LERFIIEYEEELVEFVKDCRGSHLVSFLGTWTPRGGKTANQLYLTPTTRNKETVVRKFIEEFEDIWKRVSTVLSWNYLEQVENI